jgi:hypothetical protein
VSTVVQAPGVERSEPSRRAGVAHVVGPRLRMFVLALPAIAALVVWRLSLLHVNVSNLGDYGLPPALPVAWYAALGLAVIGAVTAITARRTSGLIMVGSVVVIAIILFGTVPVLSAQPHYAWVYKHIGVVRYLEVHGKVNPSIDIYNRWPGFFALAAAFSRVAGSPNPEVYANWAELFFSLSDVVLVMAAVKALTRELRIAAGAGLFFIITNWVGQSYFSPQAFAFTLSLALIVVMLRQLRVDEAGYSRRLTRLIERVGRVPQLHVPMDGAARWPRWAALAIVLGLDAVIVASHQLTPYMLLVGIALLMLVGIARPWWVLIVMAIMTFAYLGANLHFIIHNYGVFSSFDPFNNAQGPKITQTPSAGKAFNTRAELLLIVTLWLGAVCAVIRLLKCGLLLRALPFVVLAVSPIFVLFGQNYGGEASLRVVLFSSPWCAGLISWALATVTRQRLKRLLMASAAIVYTALFIPSFFGIEELNIISPAEVRASEWFYYHARRGSVLVLSAPGFPYRYGATYSEFKGPEGDANPNLVSAPRFQSRQLGAAEVPYVAARIKEYSKYGYIVFTKDQTAYAEVLGITPPGALEHLRAAVVHSPDFRLWYSNGNVQIYELVKPPKTIPGPLKASPRKPHGVRLHTRQLVKHLDASQKYVFVWRGPRVGIVHPKSILPPRRRRPSRG